MLRTRREEALAATRRAIEATAVAYRVWEHPELADIYVKAYPHAGDPRHPRQYQPDGRYVREFRTANLFAPEGPTFRALKVYYDLASAMATHAGIGALASHRDGELSRVAPFLGGDPRELTNTWYTLPTAYMEMLKIFIRMLRSNAPAHVMDVLGQELLAWRDRTAVQVAQRAPWMEETMATLRDA
jgi:hypothetical protein